MRSLCSASLAVFWLVAPLARAQPLEPAPQESELGAGGLAPPEAVESPPQQLPASAEARVEEDLELAEQEDTGRGLEFAWLNGEVGYQFTGLEALSGNELVDGRLIEQRQAGPVYGAGLGIRLFVLTLGARFRYNALGNGRLWSLAGEGSLRIPLGRLELYVLLAGGYVAVGGFSAMGTALDLAQVSIAGVNARTGGGLDFYVSNSFSVGANVSGEVLFLQRSASDVPAMAQPSEVFYASEGSGVGAAFSATAVLGLHF